MSKARRFRQPRPIKKILEAQKFIKAPHKHYLIIKELPRKRWKEEDAGGVRVDRPRPPWSADPTPYDVGSRFLIYHVISRV